jgi:hypothetical protein
VQGLLRWGAGLALCLLLTSCGGGGSGAPAARSSATVPTVPPSTVPADPYAVPEVIDAAYLNRVFVALEHVDGDATRLIVANKKLIPEAAQRLISIYDEEELHAQTDLWLDLLAKDMSGFKTPPGDRKTNVDRVISATAQCLYVAVARDYRDISAHAGPPNVEYVALKPLAAVRNSAHFNPTPWMIASEGSRSDGGVPDNPCDG